ncbi:TPA: hypothetical protein ACTXCD_005491 [Klebsiella quasipneumoniae subsp. similipneumoniae]
MTQRYNTGNPRPSNSMKDLNDNALANDDYMNSEADTFIDRLGDERDTLRGSTKKMLAAGAAVVEETRQNLIPLSRQYMTLADAQADIANIPVNSTTYVRSQDGSALADEYINNGGTLEATGRSLPSDAALEPVRALTDAVEYLTPAEFERSGVDSATLDKNRRILMYWVGNKAFYISVSAKSAEFERLSVGGASVNAQDLSDMAEIAGQFAFTNPDEFARSGADYAMLDKNNRILILWKNNQAQFTSVYSKDATFSMVTIDGNELNGDVVVDMIENAEQISFSDENEYDRSGIDFAVLDKNMRVVSFAPETSVRDTDIWFSKLSGSLYQLYKLNSLNGTVTQLEVTTTNETNIQDRGDIVIWNSDRVATISNQWFNGSVPGNLWFSPKSKYSPHPVSPRPNVAFWGHSFTADPRMAARLYEKTNLQCFIFGRSNGISNGIAARQGGRQQEYMPAGGVIPATATAVNLVPNKPGPLALGGNGNAGDALRHCWLAGVYGKLAWDGSQVTFTRDVAGDAVQVPYAVPLKWEAVCTAHCINTITNQNTWAGTAYPQNAEAINVLWIGRNNYADLNQVVHDLVGMVELIEKNTLHPRIVIMPEFPAQAEVAGSAAHTAIMALNAKYKSLYPEYYCEVDGIDALENFRRHYNPALADDVTDVNNGVTPRSLRYDPLHPSQTLQTNALYIGAEVNADFIQKFLQSKGWL